MKKSMIMAIKNYVFMAIMCLLAFLIFTGAIILSDSRIFEMLFLAALFVLIVRRIK